MICKKLFAFTAGVGATRSPPWAILALLKMKSESGICSGDSVTVSSLVVVATQPCINLNVVVFLLKFSVVKHERLPDNSRKVKHNIKQYSVDSTDTAQFLF